MHSLDLLFIFDTIKQTLIYTSYLNTNLLILKFLWISRKIHFPEVFSKLHKFLSTNHHLENLTLYTKKYLPENNYKSQKLVYKYTYIV